MPGTFSDSWRMTKTSFRMVAEDRALLVFPLVAGLAILGVVTVFLAGELWLVFPGYVGTGGAAPYTALGILLFLVAYFVMSFIGVYATAALIGAATLKLNGQQPTAADGWRIARSRIGRLLAWALITATVGLAIQLISSRVRGVGGLVIGLVGGATWSVVTYFMVPVILYENEGAWKGLARSAHLFVSTFGRTLVSNLVVGLIVGGGIVAAVILGVVGLVEIVGGALVLGLVLVGAAITVGVVVGLIGATVEGILRATLYRYATSGKVDPDLLPSAYARRPDGPVTAPLP
jgi:hypothetical protein